jgi:hypothetical protein
VAEPGGNTGATTPPTIGYTLTVYFSADTTPVPVTIDIDTIVGNAFVQPTIQSLLDSLSQTGGGFSTTTDAIYSTQNVPAGIDDEIPIESLGGPNEMIPFILALSGTFTLMAAITAAVASVQRRRATQKGGDPNGEGNASGALVRKIHDEIQPTTDESEFSEANGGLSRSSSSSSFFMSPRNSAFQPV